jgi:hypothetical protein
MGSAGRAAAGVDVLGLVGRLERNGIGRMRGSRLLAHESRLVERRLRRRI